MAGSRGEGAEDRENAGRPEEEQEPLLASYRGRPDLDRHLRENLRTLRDACRDEGLRSRFDEVLAGRSRLRDLALDPGYQRYLGPLVLEGARRWEEAGRPADHEPEVGGGGGGGGTTGGDVPPSAPMAGGTW